MKKYLGILVLFVAFSMNAQSLSNKFNAKAYAQKQTSMLKTTLDLSDTMAAQVYKVNLQKAYSVKKHILLFEKEGKATNKTLKQLIKEVNVLAEKSSDYQDALRGVLGADLYKVFEKKFK